MSVAMLALGGVGTPANAGAVKDNVCNSLQSQVASATTAITLATAVVANSTANHATQFAALQSIKGTLITAAINLVNAADVGQNQGFFQTQFNNAVAAYTAQAVAYVSSKATLDSAETDLTFKQQVLDILAGMDSGLACP